MTEQKLPIEGSQPGRPITSIENPPFHPIRETTLDTTYGRTEADILKRNQQQDVPAYEIPGFSNLRVIATTHQKSPDASTSDLRVNQDTYECDPVTGLFLVLDAVGSHPGQLNKPVSIAAAHAITNGFGKLSQEILPQDQERQKPYADLCKEVLDNAAQIFRWPKDTWLHETTRNDLKELLSKKEPEYQAVYAIHALANAFQEAHMAAKREDGSTTATGGCVYRAKDGTRYAILMNVGDSGALLQKQDGSVVSITEEDSMIGDLLSTGHLTSDDLQYLRTHPEKTFTLFGKENITLRDLRVMLPNGLGYAKLRAPQLTVIRVEVGDRLLLATDGILDQLNEKTSENLDLKEIAKILHETTDPDPTAALDNFIAAVRKRDLKDDDIAAVMVLIT